MHLPQAVDRLIDVGQVVRLSRAYASAAVGPEGQPEFVNAAALVETRLPPEEVWLRLRRIEASMGRVRTADKYAPRPIDLDLALYEDLVVDSPGLRLPDPDLVSRAYLAVTLAELDPDFPHPISGQTLGALAQALRSSALLSVRSDILLSSGQRSP